MTAVAVVQFDLQSIGIASICTGGTQSRKQLDKKTIADLREDIHDGNPITPIVLFFDGDRYWVGDGYHRLEAYKKEKRDIIRAEVRPGSKEDALRFNIESNASADKTRWTNADKRNAVTLLLQMYGYGEGEVSRKRAEEIMVLARCCRDHVYEVAKELRSAGRSTTNLPQTSQPPVVKELPGESVPEDEANVRDEQDQEKPQAKPSAPAGRRSVEMAERDAKIAELTKEGVAAAEIARRLNVSASTVSLSLTRQKLTPETANPLVNVLQRAQLSASEWQQISSLLRDGNGAAASWPTATREQKKEVIRYVHEAIRSQKDFINRLNKEAKG